MLGDRQDFETAFGRHCHRTNLTSVRPGSERKAKPHSTGWSGTDRRRHLPNYHLASPALPFAAESTKSDPNLEEDIPREKCGLRNADCEMAELTNPKLELTVAEPEQQPADTGRDQLPLVLLNALPCIILDEGNRLSRNARRFYSAVRVFLSHLVDSSAFEEISSGREVSVIFTANGPLIYRWESKNQNPSARL